MGYTGVHMQHRIAKTYRQAVSMDARCDGHTHGLLVPHSDPIADYNKNNLTQFYLEIIAKVCNVTMSTC